MAVRILLRRDYTSQWNNINPILKSGEIGIEICDDGTRKLKTGNDINDWRTLPYLLDRPISIDQFLTHVNNITDAHGATSIPTADLIAKFNEDGGLKSDKVPADNNDVIRKTELDLTESYLTAHKNNTLVHGATTVPATSKIAMYNENAGLKSNKVPTENNDVVRFLEFNNEISDITSKISTLNGAYYVLDSYDFGKVLDETNQDDIDMLNTYTIANTPGAVTMDDVYNDTVIVNEFDTSEFVYNKISGSWIKYPNGYLTIATNNHLGVVKGTRPPADPTDESKDTYIQVLADGAMKLVGDRLGKVNTVDGVVPASNKDIELTIAMTKAEHDALEDPLGSGLYPSLAGKTVTITDVYPDNYSGGYSLNEVKTKRTWIDGKPIYERVFTGNIVAAVNTVNLLPLSQGIDSIISCGGWWMRGITATKLSVPDTTDTSWSAYLTKVPEDNNTLYFRTVTSSERTGTVNNAYQIWAQYTKI